MYKGGDRFCPAERLHGVCGRSGIHACWQRLPVIRCGCRCRRAVPAALYNAVAEVLAYVYQLANWRAQGGDYPSMPRNLPVPPELVPEGA